MDVIRGWLGIILKDERSYFELKYRETSSSIESLSNSCLKKSSDDYIPSSSYTTESPSLYDSSPSPDSGSSDSGSFGGGDSGGGGGGSDW